ncbi:MAG: RNA methyltransferase [Eggerthellaceae bacterium]|nr:RNA methyltransferase [Eggerthellaceae bacterium]
MNLIRITEADDSRVDIFSRFSDAELKRGWSSKGPIEQGALFVAESRNVIERALDGGVVPAAVFADDKWLSKADDLVQRMCAEIPDLPVYATSAELFRQITGYSQVRGILAAMHRPTPKRAEELLANARRVAVLENVGNYTNIGAMFRSAAALGLDAVLVTPSCHDPLYRRAARVSMGTVFQVPWAYIGEDSVPETVSGDCEASAGSVSGTAANWTVTGLPLLRRFGFKTVALALTDDSVPIDDAQLKACEKLAMVLGTEGDGLAQNTISACDFTARIPMAYGVDSLNVAAASAVAFWELRVR